MSKSKLISNPAEWWAAFERQAKSEGMNLSEWVGECCRANVAEKLPDRRPRGGVVTTGPSRPRA